MPIEARAIDSASAYISGMKRYRLDPKNPRQLTDEEARRLDEAAIDYSDIPPLFDQIDWTNCPDVESVPGRCSGAWVVKDSRVIVESCILGNAADCTPEEIADLFTVPVATVRRILRFARLAEAASLLQQAETIMDRLWQDESDRGELASVHHCSKTEPGDKYRPH